MAAEQPDIQTDVLTMPTGAVRPDAAGASQPRVWLIALLLFGATLVLYGRAVGFDFVAYDDHRYVVDNSQVHRGLTSSNIKWALTTVFYTNYSPVLMLTELTISSLFGTGPAAFHATNILLHAANVALAFLVLRRMGGGVWISCIAAAVWGWHSLRVESVAWISELKDVLCGFFWLLTMLAYLRYARRPTIARYLLVVLGFVAALSSKPMAVTLPFVLLLLDVFPLERLTGPTGKLSARRAMMAISEKAPLILLSAIWSRITVVSQLDALASFPIWVRVANAIVSTADYLRDTLIPRRLAVFYPHPAILKQAIPLWTVVLSGAVLMVVSAWVIILAIKRRPAALVGWLWFLGSLVPVLGLVQANQQSRGDRNTYIPSLGLAAAAVWLVSTQLSGRSFRQSTTIMVAGALAFTLVAETVVMEHQLSTWRNSEALFLHAIAMTDDNYLAYNELANVRFHEGRAAEALTLADSALRLQPNSKFGLVTRGLALLHLDRNQEALHSFRQAILLDPKDADLRHKDALLLVMRGRYTDAEQQFKKSIELDNDDATTRDDYAALLALQNRLPEAKKQWQAAVTIDPHYADAHAGLAHLAHAEGDIPTAIARYQMAIQNAKPPIKPQWLLDLAWLEATAPDASAEQIDDALARAKDAVPDPSHASPLALDTLAAALARSGQFDDAAAIARHAAEKARSAGDAPLEKSILGRVRSYERGAPYVTAR